MREFKSLMFVTGALYILGVCTSCKDDKLGDPIIVSNIKKEFYLDIAEDLGPESRITEFKVRTIEDSECLNGTIDFDYSHIGNRLTVLLNEVVIPDDCIPGIAPSTADVTAGELASGFYLFHFDLRNTVKNNGTLVVEDNRYLLELETEEGVILLHKEVFRVPENTLWGYVAYNDVNQQPDAESILDQIRFYGMVPALEHGYYGFFTINNSDPGIEISNVVQANFISPFIMNYDGDWAYMKGLVEDLESTYPEVSIKMFDDKGGTY
ncbi:MAG: hypothetical protein DWQ02_10890 [Bacteroidetes bacterium]|nr:MAG: hypothetical protein DWQ02_10890 [Bacteroidota bacterium]